MQIQIRNTRFEVKDSQHNKYWQYINSGEWETETFDVLDYFLNPTSTMLDIGAWGGPISFYAANIAQKVYAIEADPSIYKHLTDNLALNPDLANKIFPTEIALAAQDKLFTLHARNQYGSSSSSLLHRTRDNLSSVEVKGQTLKTFLTEKNITDIDFIKMDIEGGEFELLPKLAEDLERLNYPSLLISFHHDNLNEYHYQQRISLKYLALFLMKLERYSNTFFYKKDNLSKIHDSLTALNKYKFIYTTAGKNITWNTILNNPLLIRDYPDLVFTNKEWNKS